MERAYLSRFPGNYLTGDGGHFDEEGYLSIMGRIDDVINVAGHRLSTGAMEEVLASHKDVAECAVVGVDDSLKGEVPVGYVVLKAGVAREEQEICKELVQLVRDRIGPVAFFKTAAVVKKLPKTRSGKILRGTIRKIADGVDYKVPATIEDPAALDEVSGTLRFRKGRRSTRCSDGRAKGGRWVYRALCRCPIAFGRWGSTSTTGSPAVPPR